MNTDKFKESIRQEFTKNTPDILNDIKQNERFFIPKKEEKSPFYNFLSFKSVRYSLVSTFLLVIVAVFMLTGETDNQVYASTIVLDINPQIEIVLDENDIVMTVSALNDDGITVIDKDIEYKGMTLDEVIEYIVAELDEQGYIISAEDNVVMIYVDGTSEEIQNRVLQNVESKLEKEGQKYNKIMRFVKTNDYDITPEEARELTELAAKYRINPGRLILIQQIRKIDDTYSVRELARMNMRDLYQLEKDLKENNNGQPFDNGNGNGNSNRDQNGA